MNRRQSTLTKDFVPDRKMPTSDIKFVWEFDISQWSQSAQQDFATNVDSIRFE